MLMLLVPNCCIPNFIRHIDCCFKARKYVKLKKLKISSLKGLREVCSKKLECLTITATDVSVKTSSAEL